MTRGSAPAKTVAYEVWRSHPNGRDVRVYFGMSEEQGQETLAMCVADKAKRYMDAAVDFYLVRATTTYEHVTPPTEQPTAEYHDGALYGIRHPGPAEGCGYCIDTLKQKHLIDTWAEKETTGD